MPGTLNYWIAVAGIGLLALLLFAFYLCVLAPAYVMGKAINNPGVLAGCLVAMYAGAVLMKHWPI